MYSRDLWPRRLLDVRAGRPVLHPPAAVVWPKSTEEVIEVVQFARQEGIPLVPFGAGSGVCGAVKPHPRAIVVDMKAIADWKIDRDAMTIDVGAGAMGITLEEDIQRLGFTVGHFPSSILCSTVGGWIAARGAGQCSGLYGKMEDMTVELDTVLGTGEPVHMRRRESAPDLIPLMVGSEGTLGVITRARLRLHAAPEERGFLAYSFPTIEAGWEAIREVFQAGLRPAVTRLYDPIDSFILKQGSVKDEQPAQKKASSRKRNLGPLARTILKLPKALNAVIEAAEGNLLGGATLILLFEGSSGPVREDTELARSMLDRMDCESMGEAPARRWLEHRYSVSYRQAPVFRLGAFSDTMEVAAPWSKLGALYDGVRDALGDHVLVMAHLSHAYPDGCSIYFTFSGAAKDDDEALAKYDQAWQAALKAAIDAGGTLSHHHGVGRSKAPSLGQELGYGVRVARDVLRALDPSGVMNPGNLLPRTDVPIPQTPIPELGLDVQSRTVTCDASSRVSEVEASLVNKGFTLGVPLPSDDSTVGAWLAAGGAGARANWDDPVRQLCPGLVADMGHERLVIRSAPRRAVGPDLSALFLGAGERIGPITQATLAVRRRDQPPARNLPVGFDIDPAISPAEDAAFGRIAKSVLQP